MTNSNRNKEERIAETISEIILSKTITDDHDFKEWYISNEYADSFIGELQTEDIKEKLNNFNQEQRFIQALTLKRQIKKSKLRKLYIKLSSVAAIVIAVALVVWSFDNSSQQDIVSAKNHEKKPILILDNGKSVLLDSIQDVDYIDYKGNNTIAYKQTTNNKEEKFNTLIIPSQYIYTITLSDNTKVTLNANSKLIYPVSFRGEKREVTLEGEAYFEVTKSDIPFIVRSGEAMIKVYGTTFNVNSYAKDNLEAVLLSGKIGVTLNNEGQILFPNQHITIDKISGKNSITNVEGCNYIMWINGQIKSYDSELGDLIDKLSNWYGVEMLFANKAKRSIQINALLDNNQPLENIIPIIEFSTNVKIKKVKGGYIIL